MRMRTEWQPLVAGREGLRAMVIEEQKCAKAIQPRCRERPTSQQIAYVVTVCRVAAQHALERGHLCRMNRDRVARRKSFLKRFIETRIERCCLCGILSHGISRGDAALMLMGFS